jgi:hypothetical protein
MTTTDTTTDTTTVTTTVATPTHDLSTAPSDAARKVAAAAAIVFALGLFWTVASVDVPHEPSDAELLQWWQQSGNRMSGLASGLSAITAAVSFPVVLNYLRRLTAASRAPQWLAFARTMGAAVTAVWLVTGAARTTIGHLVDVMNEPLPRVDVLRFATALNYTLLGLSGMAVLSLAMLAVSVVVLRTDVLGRWVGYLGMVCGVIILGAVLAQYGAIATLLAILWAIFLAVAIWRQPADLPA